MSCPNGAKSKQLNSIWRKKGKVNWSNGSGDKKLVFFLLRVVEECGCLQCIMQSHPKKNGKIIIIIIIMWEIKNMCTRKGRKKKVKGKNLIVGVALIPISIYPSLLFPLFFFFFFFFIFSFVGEVFLISMAFMPWRSWHCTVMSSCMDPLTWWKITGISSPSPFSLNRVPTEFFHLIVVMPNMNLFNIVQIPAWPSKFLFFFFCLSGKWKWWWRGLKRQGNE